MIPFPYIHGHWQLQAEREAVRLRGEREARAAQEMGAAK